jgi:hypothetical protein
MSFRTRFEASASTTAALIVLALALPERGAAVSAQEPKADPSARADRPAKGELGPGAVRSLLAVISQRADKAARPLVVLGRPAYPDPAMNGKLVIDRAILPRELVRQAVLIAARDELGLQTRDEVIDDYGLQAAGEPAPAAEVTSSIRDQVWHAEVRTAGKGEAGRLCSDQTRCSNEHIVDLLKLTVAAEALSRQEFPKALKDLGLKGTPNDRKESTDPALPRFVEARLSSLGYSQHLVAIRDVHEAIRTKGETPAALGALVRGYAQLGVLTEFLWNPAHKAFKARALLYAQRLVARSPDRPWGLWHRAFALALVGRPRDAQVDLESAKKLAAGSKDVPPWLELIDAFAHCDTKRLEGRKGPGENLAALLRMLTFEYPAGWAINVQTSRAVLQLDPLCFRAADVMCDSQGVRTQHVSTVIGPQALERFFPEDLASLQALPASSKDGLEAEVPIRGLALLLQKAGDPDRDSGEPSWAVLAHLIRETQFVQTWRRIHFMKRQWGVEVDEFWNQARPDVAAHRYRAFLETYALPPQESAQSFRQLAEHIDLSDVEVTARPMVYQLSLSPVQRGKDAWDMAFWHGDNTSGEMADLLAYKKSGYEVKAAEQLMIVCADHPFARATLIRLAWDKVKDKVAEWEKQAPDNPSIMQAIGQHWSDAKNYDEARRVLKRYIEVSPDLWGYRTIAESYKAQGDMVRWQETLDDFVNKVEDLGLDHAKVRVELAEYFMNRKEWDKAMVYAEDAGQSWAQWAMDCAAKCAEGAEHWEQAETWHQRNAERYASAVYDWYLFCKRTGHGNVAAAAKFTLEYILSLNQDDLRSFIEGCFYWLEGQHEKARNVFSTANGSSKQSGFALCLAVLLDKSNDAARRNAVLKEFVAASKPAPAMASAFQYVLDTILDPGDKKKGFDSKEMDRLIKACPEAQRSFASFFIAGFLRNHGQVDVARALYEGSASAPNLWPWYRCLAQDALRSLKGK